MQNGKPWPTLVIEIGVSENIADFRRRRQLYLNHETSVNVFIGVGYHRNTNPADDTWHVCVAHRDINPGTPPVNPGPTRPPFVDVFESNDEPTCHLLSVAQPQWVFQIDTDLMWYPQTPPQGVPQQFTIDCDAIRQAINFALRG